MLSGLVFALAAQGPKVSVITSQQRYDAPAVRLPARETLRRQVHRVPTTRFGRSHLEAEPSTTSPSMSPLGGLFGASARRGDIIVAKTDPPMLSLLAAPIARMRQARLINWLQDLFPKSLKNWSWAADWSGPLIGRCAG